MKLIFFLSLFILVSCGKEVPRKSSETKQDVSALYSAKKLNVKVYYEPGAEPYTDSVGVASFELWGILRSNLTALFQGRSTEIEVPGKLDQMIKLNSQNKSSWSLDEVMDLAKKNPSPDDKGVSTFQIFFLNGYADNNSGIIGFHISHTKIMAIFKDVIKSTGSGKHSIVPKYVEQATLVHEMGHALGLVNNGLPLQSKHQDSKNGAHCLNPDCVMYYSNEGTANMVKFAQKASEELSVVMFDSQCLEDSRNYKK